MIVRAKMDIYQRKITELSAKSAMDQAKIASLQKDLRMSDEREMKRADVQKNCEKTVESMAHIVTECNQKIRKFAEVAEKLQQEKQETKRLKKELKNKDAIVYCGVCYTNRKSVMTEPCLHMFMCNTCAWRVSQRDNRCPTCRTNITRYLSGHLI